MFKRNIALLTCLVMLLICAAARGQGEESRALFPVRQNGKWGYIDRAGKLVIKPQFDAAYPFYEGVARVMSGKRFENEKWSYIDETGKPIFTNLSVNRLEDFSEGLGAVCTNMRDETGGILCGYMDKTGKWVIEPKVYNAFGFHDGLARAALPDKTSRTGTREVYLDKTGKVAIGLSSVPARGSERFSEGLASFYSNVSVEGRYLAGFMDKNGKIVVEPKFEAVDNFSDELAAVLFFKPAKNPTEEHQEDFDAGFIDTTGQMVIRPQFGYYQPFSEGLAFVLIRGKMGAIDKTGRVVIRPQFALLQPRTKTYTNPYWFVTDYYQTSKPWSFSEGLAPVQRLRLWGYVDKTGKMVIPPRFHEAHQFSGGLALVMIGDRLGYIDKTGKFVWRPTK